MMNRHAIFSPCRTWRYTLTREWPSTPSMDDFVMLGPQVLRPPKLAAFICLNPSTATEVEDDPTVRRCMGYAREWGYGGLLMMNIFAYRATDPRVMMAAPDPVGPDNDLVLVTRAKKGDVGIVVAAWGTHGKCENRHQNILKLFQEAGIALHCLAITKDGYPGHPLYLRRNLKPVPYPGGSRT